MILYEVYSTSSTRGNSKKRWISSRNMCLFEFIRLLIETDPFGTCVAVISAVVSGFPLFKSYVFAEKLFFD